MKLDIYKKQWLDIVFEGRNKLYGAYELRKTNPKTMWRSLVIGSLIFALTVSAPMIANLLPDASADDEALNVKLTAIKLPPKKEKPKENLPPPPPPGHGTDGNKGAKSAMSKRAENAVKDALLVGNFEAAVECCFRSGNLADALILASCGGSDLWQKTQAEYFARESNRRPFLSLVSAIMQDQLTDLVAQSDPRKWKETLAVLSTYGKSEEFPSLCAALGDRLEGAGSFANASLCYMCALNLGQTARYWKLLLQKGNGACKDGSSTIDLLSLHDFIEKVTVFAQAMDSSQYQLDDDVANLFANYSKALAEQGLLISASKYLRGCDTQECKKLRDRIYRSRMGGFCPDLMASPPAFPFDFVNVGVARDLQGITLKQGVRQQLPVQQEQYLATQASQQPQMQQQQSHYVQQSPQLQPQNAQQMPQVQPLQSQSQVRYRVPINPRLPFHFQLMNYAFQSTQALPQGWVAVQDPSTGQTYYANQNTGESSWEPPMAPAAAPAPELTATSYSVPTPVSSQTTNSSFGAAPTDSTALKVASKYGDGFVTSASNPQLAEQYGNVGTRYDIDVHIMHVWSTAFLVVEFSYPFLLLLYAAIHTQTQTDQELPPLP